MVFHSLIYIIGFGSRLHLCLHYLLLYYYQISYLKTHLVF